MLKSEPGKTLNHTVTKRCKGVIDEQKVVTDRVTKVRTECEEMAMRGR